MIDKTHPNYQKFLDEVEQLENEHLKELHNLFPLKFKGRDGPTEQLMRKYKEKFKELQKKYSYLYHD